MRYVWKLISREASTHDTQLLTFHPLTTATAISEFQAGFDVDEVALHAAYPVKYSTTHASIRAGQHFSVEIPKQLPRENAENHTARERENRPLDVPFRMQRAYSPINAYQTEGENPRGAVTFLVRHYAGFNANATAEGGGTGTKLAAGGDANIPPGAGSTFMSNLPLGGLIITTGSRGLFNVDYAFEGYDTFIFIGGGTGVAPLYPVLKEMVRRAAGGKGAPSSDSGAPQFTKSFTFLSCHRSEEDVLLGDKLSEMQTEQAPGRAGVSVYTVLSQRCSHRRHPPSVDSSTLTCFA